MKYKELSQEHFKNGTADANKDISTVHIKPTNLTFINLQCIFMLSVLRALLPLTNQAPADLANSGW